MVLFPLKNNHSPTFPKDHLSFLTLRSFFTITPVFKDRVLLAKKIPRREAFHLTLGGGWSNRGGLWVWQSSCGSSASHPPAEGPSDVPGGSAGTESTCKAGGSGSVPGSGRSTGEGVGYPLQYS